MKAMVLCAGYGTRLGNLVDETPKPMLRLDDRPILECILSHLARHGFNQVVVNLHFRPEAIRDYFSDGRRWGIELSYSYEEKLLGTAGALRNVAGFFGDETFLVQYGDVVTDQDLTLLWQFHEERNALATLLIHERARSNSVVSLDNEQRIVGLLERPSEAERKTVNSPWVNSGIAVCNAELLDAIPHSGACDLPRDVYPKLLNSKRLYGFPLTGYRCAIDSPERLAEARTALLRGIL